MRILVLGPTGMLGSRVVDAVRRCRAEVRPISSREYDFRSLREIHRLAGELRPDDVVVNCCGLIRQRISATPTDSETSDAYAVNAVLPHVLASRCRLLHISTDCVYSGQQGNYVETDPPDGEDLYARSKILGEPDRALVIRTSMVGKQPSRAVSLYEWFLSQERVNGFTNHLWNGLTTNQLSRCIADLITRGDVDRHGVYHLFSDTISKYELCCEFNRYRSTPATITPVEAPVPVDRTLATLHPEFVASLGIPSLREQIREMCMEP